MSFTGSQSSMPSGATDARASAGKCKYAVGWCFTTIICEQRPYLLWLQDKVLRAGVTLQQRSITSLQASPAARH
jgi:hypothetical protein